MSFQMLKWVRSFIIIMMFPVLCVSQPFITTSAGAGLGEYGYLEKEAFTYVTLNRNNITNIDYLSARFWVTDNNNVNGNGAEYVYHTKDGPDGNWTCNNSIFFKRTLNYAPSNFSPEWMGGSDVYVSVFGKQCPVGSGPWLPSAPNGSTIGYNEKHFQVVDVDNSASVSVTNIVGDGNGNCSNSKVVASFVMDGGSIPGLALTRLKLWNVGSAQETIDIPNGFLKIWYEPSTGTESFNGNETLPVNNVIWGDWASSSLFDNFYEADNLSIPLNGRTRIYITLCDLAPGFTPGRTVVFYITTDGIDLFPSQTSNGSTRMRIDLTDVTNMIPALPVSNVKLRGVQYKDGNNLEMIINSLAPGTKLMILQRSEDAFNWTNISTYNVSPNDISRREYYDRQLNKEKYYYRLQYISAEGTKTYSYIIEITNRFIKLKGKFVLVNTLDGILFLQNNKNYSGLLNIMVTDASAKVLSSSVLKVNANSSRINIPLPQNASHGLYILSVGELSGERYSFKFIR